MVKTLVGIAKRIGIPLRNSARDLLPIIAVVSIFQLLVFRQPLEGVAQLLIGLVLVIVGLTLFVMGLELGLFPVGESMAHDVARKGSLGWMVAFAFALGFGATFAEPSLIAMAGKAAELTVVGDNPNARLEVAHARYAIVLRVTIASAVGVALMIGVWRILFGLPIQYFVIAGYSLVMILSLIAPESIRGIAYDAGGIATSTVTVPLIAALGIGLASSIQGRNPLVDGFGLIAIASLTPIVFVLLLGILWN